MVPRQNGADRRDQLEIRRVMGLRRCHVATDQGA
ncbi:hypothetical protein J2T08_004639 [Neorhizobium galegae]|nr:hypothetical protein [Neorhizobium galegae]